MPYVYLLHFATPLHHAQHYLGSTSRLRARIQEHRQPSDPTHIIHNGFKKTPFVVSKTWRFGGIWKARMYEKHLKRVYKNARYLCPICKKEKMEHVKETREARRLAREGTRSNDQGCPERDRPGRDQFFDPGSLDVGVGGVAAQG